jgi:hypothetical protein
VDGRNVDEETRRRRDYFFAAILSLLILAWMAVEIVWPALARVLSAGPA